MKTRYRFSHRGGNRYYWYSGPIPGDSRVEQISCDVDWFWGRKPRELALLLDDGTVIRDPSWLSVADVMKGFAHFGVTRSYGRIIYVDTGEVHPHHDQVPATDGSGRLPED